MFQLVQAVCTMEVVGISGNPRAVKVPNAYLPSVWRTTDVNRVHTAIVPDEIIAIPHKGWILDLGVETQNIGIAAVEEAFVEEAV